MPFDLAFSYADVVAFASLRPLQAKLSTMQGALQNCNTGGAGDPRTIMAFVRKIKGLLKLETAHNTDEVRAVLLDSYARHKTLNGVAKEFGMKPGAMSTWFRSLGLHAKTGATAPKPPPATQKPAKANAVDKRRSTPRHH